jgi:hypothetical protein
MILAEAIVF